MFWSLILGRLSLVFAVIVDSKMVISRQNGKVMFEHIVAYLFTFLNIDSCDSKSLLVDKGTSKLCKEDWHHMRPLYCSSLLFRAASGSNGCLNTAKQEIQEFIPERAI